MERKEVSGAKRLLVQETKSLGMTPPLFTITNVTHPASVTQPCCSSTSLL